PFRLCREPAYPQADRGGLRLDEDRGGAAQDQISGLCTRRLGPHLCGGPLQPDPRAEADRGGTMSASTNCQLLGRWRIVEADLWDRAFLDLCGPAYILFETGGHGEV